MATTTPPELGDAVPTPPRELDRAMVRGFTWSATSRAISQTFAWLATLVIARLLSPSDYGIVGMAATFLGFVRLLTSLGIGHAIIVMPEMTDEQIGQLNTVSVIFGWVTFAVACAVAYPAALFYRTPQLTLVIVVSALGFIISASRSVPSSLLRRDLEFRKLATMGSTMAFVQAVTGVTLALLGFGYWALVLNHTAASIVGAVMSARWSSAPFLRPRMAQLREPLLLTRNLVSSRIAWFIYANADTAIAGRVLGKGPLGAYAFAWSLTNLPVEKITTTFVGMTQIFFSKVKNSKEQLRRYLRLLTEVLALATFPAAVGMAIVADDFVHVVLGDRWAGVVAPLQVLALSATIRCVSPILVPLLNAAGKSRLVLWNSIYMAIALPPAFYMGSRWGTVGIAMAWAIIYPPLVGQLLWVALRSIDMHPLEYLRALRPALTGCAVMAASVFAVRFLVPEDWHRAVRLALQVAAGAGAYATLMLTAYKDRMQAYLKLFKESRA